MSIDTIKAFWSRVQADDAIGREFAAVRTDTEATTLADIVALASRHGFAFTVAEYQDAIRAKAVSELEPPDRLSDEDLDRVAGGCACESPNTR